MVCISIDPVTGAEMFLTKVSSYEIFRGLRNYDIPIKAANEMQIYFPLENHKNH